MYLVLFKTNVINANVRKSVVFFVAVSLFSKGNKNFEYVLIADISSFISSKSELSLFNFV